MPSVEHIEEFNTSLVQVGNEPEIVAGWGEAIEEVNRPETVIDNELSDLLQEASEDDGSGSEDLSALLEGFGEEIEGDDAGDELDEDESDPLSEISLMDEDFVPPPDAPDTFGDEDFSTDSLDELGDLGESDEPGPPVDAFDELGDLGDLGDLSGDDTVAEDAGDLGDLGEFEETAGPDLPDTTEPDTPGDALDDLGELGDLDDFGDLGDFDIDDESAGIDDSGNTEETFEEFAATDDELGDLDDLAGSDDVLGDLGDLGDIEGVDDSDSDDSDIALTDFGDLGDEAVPDEAEAGDGFEDIGDLDGIDVSDSFGNDFADQVAAEFGDSDDLDADGLSDDPFSDGGDSFDLPAVDESLDEIGDENFSLDDFGEGFDLDEESLDDFASVGQPTDLDDDAVELEDVAGDAPDREFTDEEFDHIKRTLNSLPLNLKTPVEEVIGNSQGSTADQNQILDLLIQGSEPTKIAEIVSRILDKRIVVPKGYQKRTGLDFEEQTQSLSYRFTHYVLPVIRVAMVISVGAALLGFLLFRFVYKPIYSQILYKRGYEDLVAERYVPANDTFERAHELRPRDVWFVRYAEGFVQKRQYDLAVEKYDQLVFGMNPARRDFLLNKVREKGLIEIMNDDGTETRVYDALNVDVPAIMDHALLQSRVLANYERANDLYSIILFGDEFNYDALLARGDNYMRWAGEDPARFENARLTYAKMISRYGDNDEILMRFLRYFVRTDNEERVREVVNIFEVMTPGSQINAEIYAEAAGYLLDHGGYGRVRDMLVRASEAAPALPEVYYQMARYNRMNESPVDEEAALQYARDRFEAAEPLDRRQLEMYIDTLVRRGEFQLNQEEILTARAEFDLARRKYEEGRRLRFIPQNPKLARLYAGLGDIEYYYGGDLDRALELYDRAAAEGYITDEGEYKRGYVHYRRERYGEAVDRFFEIGATNPFATKRNVLYARANTLYMRANYFAAEAFYRRLLDSLQTERERIANLMVDEDPKHRALVEYLIRVQNNLGVTLFRISEQDVTRTEQFSEALYHLQESADLAENYLRNPETGERALARNLAYLNIREILYPSEDFDPQIHSAIPRDPDQVLF